MVFKESRILISFRQISKFENTTLQYADPKLTCSQKICYYEQIHNFCPISLRLGQDDPLMSWSFCSSLKEIG